MVGPETWGCPGFSGLAWGLALPLPGPALSRLGGLGAPPALPARGSQAGRCVSEPAGIRPLAPELRRASGRGAEAAAPQGALPSVVPAASGVTHVLHSHAAPDAQHEALDVALVGTAHDAEVAPLAPAWAPGVGRRPVFEHPSIWQRLFAPPCDLDRVGPMPAVSPASRGSRVCGCRCRSGTGRSPRAPP